MLVCDLVRQFINIAIGGMAFSLGLTLATKISLWLPDTFQAFRRESVNLNVPIDGQ